MTTTTVEPGVLVTRADEPEDVLELQAPGSDVFLLVWGWSAADGRYGRELQLEWLRADGSAARGCAHCLLYGSHEDN